MVAYYAARAAEYEKIYDKPERQAELTRLTAILQDLFRHRQVLEIACGTGWWTHRLAPTAAAVLATDINEPVLDVARAKDYGSARVRFQQDDIFDTAITDRFEALFGAFIWSHIALDQLDTFLAITTRQIMPGGLLVFADNRYVPGSSTPISRVDENGNSRQTRTLRDGSTYEVLKNFPDAAFLREKLSAHTETVEILELEYYWLAIGKMPG